MNPEATKKWAICQDRIFAGEASGESIYPFWALCRAQEEITPTNLTLRNRLILASAALGGMRPVHIQKALSQFNTLHRNGYWLEGKSYWDYTLKGLNWYNTRHGLPENILKVMESITENYQNLSPCPLPEVSNEGFTVDGPDFVSTPSYFKKLWRKDGKVVAGIWIALDADPEPRKNLHHHLEAGYFAFWNASDFGFWRERCKPYTSFNFQESLTSSSLAACLPKGALPPTWRAKPPRVKVWGSREIWTDENGILNIQTFRFSWQTLPFIKITRKIEVYPDKVVVTDGGTLRKSKVREFRV